MRDSCNKFVLNGDGKRRIMNEIGWMKVGEWVGGWKYNIGLGAFRELGVNPWSIFKV